MRKIKEILRLRLGERRSLREVGSSVGVSSSTVHDTVIRAQAAGLGWPLDPDLDEAILDRMVCFATAGLRAGGVPRAPESKPGTAS